MKKQINFRATGRKVLRGSENVAKFSLAAIFEAVGFELTFMGLQAAKSDVKAIGRLGKYAVKPDVYKVKKRGFFHKSKNVNINPITGSMKPDKTGKKPINKKAIRF